VSDINTALVDRLKALDPNRPIREADMEIRWRLPDHRVGGQEHPVWDSDAKCPGGLEIDH